MMKPSKKSKNKRLFGELAVSKGIVSDKVLQEALIYQQKYDKERNIHKRIGEILVEKGALTSEDVKTVLEAQNAKAGLLAWFTGLFHLSR